MKKCVRRTGEVWTMVRQAEGAKETRKGPPDRGPLQVHKEYILAANNMEPDHGRYIS
jgi:hypothetical protein